MLTLTERILLIVLLAKLHNFLFIKSDFQVDKRRYANIKRSQPFVHWKIPSTVCLRLNNSSKARHENSWYSMTHPVHKSNNEKQT